MANKMKTPILRPLRNNGATLYVFPSASEDIGLNLNNGTNGVAMSHYALLNFTNNNFGYTNPNDIINDLLNYVMNHEISVINDSGYNYQEPYTVSEHVLWHWLMHKNSINLRLTETDESNHNNIWKEDWTDRERLVQCFGSIDAGNSLSTEFGMFNETYVSVPTSYGNGPVFFRKVTDNNNYKPGASYDANSITKKIWGRENDSLSYLGASYSLILSVDNEENNTYIDDTPFEIVKDMSTIQKGCQLITDNLNIIMSSYDDVNIDTNNDFASTDYSMQTQTLFNFNAILLYYSIYNNDDIYKEPIATNLFGIVFLDGGTGSGNYLLAPLTKKKSYSGNSSGGYFGNSYSFRVNIKTLSVYDNTDALISDNTTITSAYSLDFSDVIYNLNRAIDIMNTNVQTTASILNAYTTILALNYDLQKKFSDVSTSLTNYITELTSAAFETLNSSLAGAFETFESTYTDTAGLSSDGTTRLSTSQYLNRRIVNSFPVINSQSDFTYGSNNEQMKSNVVEDISVSKDYEFERLISIGIVPIKDILLPRAKKPETSGYYFKQNTSGNIVSYVYFNGSEYTETNKCQSGKMYTMNGLIYVFNGETCKLIGE